MTKNWIILSSNSIIITYLISFENFKNSFHWYLQGPPFPNFLPNGESPGGSTVEMDSEEETMADDLPLNLVSTQMTETETHWTKYKPHGPSDMKYLNPSWYLNKYYTKLILLMKFNFFWCTLNPILNGVYIFIMLWILLTKNIEFHDCVRYWSSEYIFFVWLT